MNPLLGKTLTAIWLASDKMAIRFDPIEGEPIIARTDGDCCSHSWIESLDAPEVLIGIPILSVDDIRMLTEETKYGGEIANYGLRITTSKGVCVLVYRNESNGYYGGSLVWPGESYYGGVHGQNVSTQDWVQLVPKKG